MQDEKQSNLEALRRVWSKDHGRSTGERALLAVLVAHRNQRTGRCSPSQATIAAETGMARSGVQKLLTQLEMDGIIERKNDSGLVAGYVLHLEHLTGPLSRPVPAHSVGPTGPLSRHEHITDKQITDKGIKPLRNGHPPKTRQTWLTPYGEIWESRAGGEPNYKALAAALAGPRRKHTDAVLLPAWQQYVNATEPAYLSGHRFASTINSWLKAAKPRFSGYS